MGKVNFGILQSGQGTTYIGNVADNVVTSKQQHLNSYFNIDAQRIYTFTMLIEGFEYGRYHASYKSITQSVNDGIASQVYNPVTKRYESTGFDNFKQNASINWIPLKSCVFSQGGIENMSIAVGAFSDIQLPFRKHCPTLTCELYDHKSDFFEMKLREWHAQSVVSSGFVPVLESITKKVTIRAWSPTGECNSVQDVQCILGEDISVSRNYADNDLKVISFKMIVVGY